jgi:hypothetical protein
MKDIDREKAALDQMQTYLAYKLTLIDTEENGTAHGNTRVVPEMLTTPFPTVWNICLSRHKGEQPVALFTANEAEEKAFEEDAPPL